MIMRIGWVTGSAYEWTQHWRVATTAGIPPEDILAARDWPNSSRLTAADKAILAATDECLAGKSISDATWPGSGTCFATSAQVASEMDFPARHSSVAARIALSAAVNREEFRQSRTARISSAGIPAVVA